MTKKTKAEIATNNNFMDFCKAEKEGKQEEWYKAYRKEYRKLIASKGAKNENIY